MVSLSFLLFMLVAGGVPAESKPPPKSELKEIRDRGRELAAYDRAAWDAGDELERMAPDMSLITHYIPRREGKRWRVVYGQLDETAGVFRIISSEPLARSILD